MVVLKRPLPTRSTRVLLAVSMSVAAAIAVAAPNDETTRGDTRVVRMVAERFSFTPSEVTVDAGTVVEIHLTSEDTAHGFRIAGPRGVDVTIPKRNRGEVVVSFEAAEPGSYVFECSRMCGAGHSFMRGRIRVRPQSAGRPRSRKATVDRRSLGDGG